MGTLLDRQTKHLGGAFLLRLGAWFQWRGWLTGGFVAVALALLVVPSGRVWGAVENPPGPLSELEVSVPHGLFKAPVSVKVTGAHEGEVIRYTLDGSEPIPATGKEFLNSLQFSNTTVLRAAAFKGKARVSTIATRSYIFLDQVKHQSERPTGFPMGDDAWGREPSAYGMESKIVDDPVYRDRIDGALRALPIVSVVLRKDDLFGYAKGIYANSTQRGPSWERACSVEWINPDGEEGFQIDCGIRVQGNYNRLPQKTPKHSFRILFKKEYGHGKLHYQVFPDSPVDKFDTLVLRADYNNSWLHWDSRNQVRAQRMRDAWMKDSQRAMGWLAAHSRFVHLYLDGLYWGIYDAAERPDGSFAASYFGGDKKDYDVINEFQVKEGTAERFDEFNSVPGLSRGAQYEKLKQRLDINEYIDYLMLNYYGANQDWGENKNWYAVRRREPSGPFRFFVWDGEQVFHHLGDDVVNRPNQPPFYLAERLRENAEFRLAFADRAQKHLFGDGALTPAQATARWMKRAAELDVAIIAESARWGGYRRDPPYNRDVDWLAEQKRLVKSYFPKRTAVLLDQLRAAGLYPQVAAPVLTAEPAAAADGTKFSAVASGGGDIYITTNGTDPRTYGVGTPSKVATVYTEAVLVPPGGVVKARVLRGGAWSALVEGVGAKGK
ncbi:MAG TPA: CotH kinase family protein [Candidatus Limnocylindria bacterium]|nr:CotH kinase family protein [Candidatus Limnocylindria bacterium]